MDNKYYLDKKKKVMEKVIPLLESFGIHSYEYIVLENPYFEILRIEQTYINISANSETATLNEVMAYLILQSDPNFKGIGNDLKRCWMSQELINKLLKK